MSLMAELLKIISQNPRAREAIDKATLAVLEGRWWKKALKIPPTRKERINRIKLLLREVAGDGFSNDFEDRLAFVGALLGIIVESALASSRGCILEKFYRPGYYFYFPAPGTEPRYKVFTNKGVEYYALQTRQAKRNEQAEFYDFYAIEKPNDNGKTLNALRSKLDEIANNPPFVGEKSAFLSHVRSLSIEMACFDGIARKLSTATIYFRSRTLVIDVDTLVLNFADTTMRAAIVSDLTQALSSTRV